MKLSILVPVYNVEKFLPLCLESLVAGKLKNFEAILVDDGSSDGSLKILKEYAAKDKRLKVYKRKNHGYGATLNFAIRKAQGEFVGIVEPDDFTHVEMFETLVRLAEKNHADIAKGSFYNHFGKTGAIKPERVFHEMKLESGAKKIITPQKEHRIFFADPSIWSAVYRRNFLEKNNLKFLETPGASFQDTSFQFRTFAAADKIVCLEKPLYYYRRDNSGSSVKSAEKILAVKKEFDFVEQNIGQKFQEIAAAVRFRSYVWNLRRLPLKAAWEFAGAVRKDYKRLEKTTDFRASYFRKNRLSAAGECGFAVRFPRAYVLLRPAFKMYNALRRAAFSIFR